MSSGKCIKTSEEQPGSVSSVALSTDGRWALSAGSNDRALHLWDVRGLLDRRAPLAVCRFTGTAETLASQKRFHALLNSAEKALSEGEFARAWSLAVESKTLPGYEFSTEAMGVAHRASLRGRRTRFRNGWCCRTFEGHTSQVNSVALSADGRWALSGGSDKNLRLWDVNSGKCIRILDGHTGRVTSVALSTDGCWGLSGSDDQTVRMWDVNSGKCIRILDGHTDRVTSVALSADARWALSGGWDKTLRLWGVSSGKYLSIAEMGLVVALSADGRLALAGGLRVGLWDVSSVTGLRTFGGYIDRVASVALSTDGRWALSGGNEKNPSPVGREQRKMPPNFSGTLGQRHIGGTERGWPLGAVRKRRSVSSPMGVGLGFRIPAGQRLGRRG